MLRTRLHDKRADDEHQVKNAVAAVAVTDAATHVVYIVMLVLMTGAHAFVYMQICGLAIVAAVYVLCRRGLIRENGAALALLCEIGLQSVGWMVFFGFPSLAYCHVLCFFIPSHLVSSVTDRMLRALQTISCGFALACIAIGVTMRPIFHNETMTAIAAVTLGIICAMRTLEAFVNKDQMTRSIARYERSIAGARDDSMRDPLTGLWNRRYLEYSSGNYEFMSSTAPCTVAMLDLDLFKKVNDTYNHLVGDQMLLYFSSFLKKNLRASDHIVRWGGEEFLIIFTNTDAGQTYAVLNNLREDFKTAPMPLADTFIPMTFTAGLCQLKDGASMLSAIETADAMLYAGKTSGRDKVVAG